LLKCFALLRGRVPFHTTSVLAISRGGTLNRAAQKSPMVHWSIWTGLTALPWHRRRGVRVEAPMPMVN
jgi:hypothetical protein